MADAPNTVSTLNGLFKEVYAEVLQDVKPKGLKLQTDIKFAPRSQMPGNKFHQPVSLTHESGFTYAGADSGAFDINDAIAATYKDATIVGTQMLGKEQLSYEAAARASKGGTQAFRSALDTMVENMFVSAKKRVEIDLFYGQNGLGTISAVSFGGGAGADTITITAAEWATGIWAGWEGAQIEIYSTNAASGTQRTTGSTGTPANQTYFTILKIDVLTRVITLSEDVSGTGIPTTSDHVFWRSAKTSTAHNVFAGLHTILTTSGSLFGIDNATFSLWKADSVAAGSAVLTFSMLSNACALAVGKGLDEDVNAYVNPNVWADVLDAEVSRVQHTKGEGGAFYEVGAEGIRFYSQNGTILIKSSNYVKQGYAYVIAPKLFKRIGATDITFKLPDRGDEFFLHIPTKAGYELRCYSNQSLFCKAPGQNAYVTGITT
jgi:hypothetical protein